MRAGPLVLSRSTARSRAFRTLDGLRAATRRAAALGFEGKMAIHPSQIEIIHEVLTPAADQIAWANEVIEAMAAADREGRGAVKDKNGEMIDLMHVKLAKKLLERAASIGANVMSALRGIRVLDLGTFIAGPYCATILGEFGAEVIKVEPPKTGDSLRRLGTDTECGDTLVWLSESPQQEMRDAGPADRARPRTCCGNLRPKCDIVVENFRPGTLEKWGLGYDDLKKLNPGAILVRISAYGQDGPMRSQPGFARIAHAFSGLTYLAGEPGGRCRSFPAQRRLPITCPACTARSARWSRCGRARRAARDSASISRSTNWCFACSTRSRRPIRSSAMCASGWARIRSMSARTAITGPATASGSRSRAPAIRCSHVWPMRWASRNWRRANAIGPKELRLAARDEVNRIVADWVASLDLDTVLALCSKSSACPPA